ncbi:MAG: hypothetical protein M3Q74_13095 [Pseudomonadota bacterium]|nr:hypothetical protein [Pseudomonadota bacterium]
MSNAFLRFGVLFALIGVSIGYYMGASHNFAASPVHAHINLLGWVSMFLYGLFYRALPEAAQGWLPKVHLGLAVLGFLIFMPALAIQLLAVQSLMSLAPIGLIVGPTLVLLGMIVFAAIVFMATGKSNRASPA